MFSSQQSVQAAGRSAIVSVDIYDFFPVNTGHCPCVISMLDQRRKCWPNIETSHGQCLVFTELRHARHAEADANQLPYCLLLPQPTQDIGLRRRQWTIIPDRTHGSDRSMAYFGLWYKSVKVFACVVTLARRLMRYIKMYVLEMPAYWFDLLNSYNPMSCLSPADQ